MKEEVKHPSRYNQGGIEFWDVEKAFFGMDSHIDHLVQSALEYGVRFRRKNGAEDLRKAANLLNHAAKLMDDKVNENGFPECRIVRRTAYGTDIIMNLGRSNHEKISFWERAFKDGILSDEYTNEVGKVIAEIEKYKAANGSAMPKVILMSMKCYEKFITFSSFDSELTCSCIDHNTITFMGVRVVVTESTKNHLDMEVL